MPGPADSARDLEGAVGILVHEADHEAVPRERGEVQPQDGVELQAPDMQPVGQGRLHALVQGDVGALMYPFRL